MTKQFKINPDLTCPELAGYRLPSFSRSQEDDVEALAENEYREYPSDPKGSNYQNNRDINCHRKRKAFIKGYTKAREKYEFTEADMKYIFECGRNYQNNGEVTFKVSIAHLRNPIAIEVEMVQGFEDEHGDFSVSMNNLDGVQIGRATRPALNPDGTVKGRYIYGK